MPIGPTNNVTTNLNQALADIGSATRVFSVEGQSDANAGIPSGAASDFQAGNTGFANAVRAISALASVPVLNLTWNTTTSLASANALATAMGAQTGIGINWNNWHAFPNDGIGGGAPFTASNGGLPTLTNNAATVAPGAPLNWTSVGYDQTLNSANGSHVTGNAGGKML